MLSDESELVHVVGEPSVAARLSSRSGALLVGAAVWLGLSTCNASLLDALFPHSAERRNAAQTETQGDLRQRQIAFLNQLRKADPDRRTIERAVFNERNELGLILNRSVELDQIPALMRSVLTQMARAFPGRDLTVLAYAPTDPPRKIGTAQLNARTRDMTYTPAR
ncbi:MAG: hypothetical protein JO069_01225 [Verrucomicrobia bacterium]|nr:hypothetical protein [Verrucomicrobiota bacterium]